MRIDGIIRKYGDIGFLRTKMWGMVSWGQFKKKNFMKKNFFKKYVEKSFKIIKFELFSKF